MRITGICNRVGAVLTLTSFLIMPLCADSIRAILFGDKLGDRGRSSAFSPDRVFVTATDYSGGDMTTDLFAKNEGPPELCLGLASGMDREIGGKGTGQPNLQDLVFRNPFLITLDFSGQQEANSYDIWGSNKAGTEGTLLSSNLTARFGLRNVGQSPS